MGTHYPPPEIQEGPASAEALSLSGPTRIFPASPGDLKPHWELLDEDELSLRRFSGDMALLDAIGYLRRHWPWMTRRILRRWVPVPGLRAYELEIDWYVRINADGEFSHKDRRPP